MTSPPRSQCGFTLIEVLIALAIVALGMVAVLLQAGQSTHATVLMRDKVLAGWIGANRVTELALQSEWPAVGESNGEVTYGGRQWRWRAEITDTASPALRRVDVTVSLARRPDETVHTVSGFLGRPATVQPPRPALTVPPQTFPEAVQ